MSALAADVKAAWTVLVATSFRGDFLSDPRKCCGHARPLRLSSLTSDRSADTKSRKPVTEIVDPMTILPNPYTPDFAVSAAGTSTVWEGVCPQGHQNRPTTRCRFRR